MEKTQFKTQFLTITTTTSLPTTSTTTTSPTTKITTTTSPTPTNNDNKHKRMARKINTYQKKPTSWTRESWGKNVCLVIRTSMALTVILS